MINRFVMINFVTSADFWPILILSLLHWSCDKNEWATREWLCISFLLISLKLLSTSELRHQLRLLWGPQRHSQKLQQPHLSSSNTTTSTHSKILFPQLPSVDELVPYCEYQYQSLRIFYLKVNCCYLLASGLKSYLMVRYFSVCSQYVMQCQDGICHVTLSWSCHVTWNCHKVVIWCDKFLGDWNHIWC